MKLLVYLLILTLLMICCRSRVIKIGRRPRNIRRGQVVVEGQFPYMVQLARIVDSNKTYTLFTNVCGASLIQSDWILSAGQCFPHNDKDISKIEKNHSVLVIAGSLQSLDFTERSSRRFVIRIIRYPNYEHVVAGNTEAISDDIAIAKVNQPFKLDKNIQLAPLPSPKFLKGQPITTTIRSCYIMGYGIEENPSKNNIHTSLRYTYIDVVSLADYNITNTSTVFISASLSNSPTNHGDIGSPVICLNMQFGLVSTLAFIDDTYVDLYTQVDQYTDFIKKYVPTVRLVTPAGEKGKSKSDANSTKTISYVLLTILLLKCAM